MLVLPLILVAMEALGKGWRSLEKKPLQEGDEARVLIHRIYSFAHGKTQIVENQENRRTSSSSNDSWSYRGLYAFLTHGLSLLS